MKLLLIIGGIVGAALLFAAIGLWALKRSKWGRSQWDDSLEDV